MYIEPGNEMYGHYFSQICLSVGEHGKRKWQKIEEEEEEKKKKELNFKSGAKHKYMAYV